MREAKLDLKKSKRKDYYKILGLDEGCGNAAIIKKAYRKQAMKYHPDRLQGDEAKAQGEIRFKEIGEAYAVLSDDQKRARYDAGDGLDPYDDSDDEGGPFGHGPDMDDLADLLFARMAGFPGGEFNPFFGGGGFGGTALSGSISTLFTVLS